MYIYACHDKTKLYKHAILKYKLVMNVHTIFFVHTSNLTFLHIRNFIKMEYICASVILHINTCHFLCINCKKI